MNTTSDEEWKTYPYLLINVSFTIPEIEPEKRQTPEIFDEDKEYKLLPLEIGLYEEALLPV